jgi:hypothetical protein
VTSSLILRVGTGRCGTLAYSTSQETPERRANFACGDTVLSNARRPEASTRTSTSLSRLRPHQPRVHACNTQHGAFSCPIHVATKHKEFAALFRVLFVSQETSTMMWNIRRSKRDESVKIKSEVPRLNLEGCIKKGGDKSRSSRSTSTNSRRSISSRHSSESSAISRYSGFSSLSVDDGISSQAFSVVGEPDACVETNRSVLASGKTVRFKDVQVRDYERIVSDNPCCSSGPPIG